MIVIKFGKWMDAQTKKHKYHRKYLFGYKWTPFCEREKKRYIVECVGKTGEKPRAELVRDENEKGNR